MIITEAYYATSDNKYIMARIDDNWSSVPAELVETRDGEIPLAVAEWIAAGGVVATYVAPPTPVPQSVTPYQARIAFNNAGLRASVEAAVAAASQDVQDAWQYATVVERSSPFIVAVGASLGLSDAQIDDLFIAAGNVV